MSPTVDVYELLALCFPRVSGDEPLSCPKTTLAVEFSPREWG